MAHIVWDWNGTLFADQTVTLTALHAVLDWAGVPRIDADEYKRQYVRPVKDFYEALFDRRIEQPEWRQLDDIWHTAYAGAMGHATLTVDARATLTALADDGHTQSLLSMYRHEHLLTLVEKFGITRRFERIEGLRGPGGGAKTPYLKQHLTSLDGLIKRPSDVMIVGDAMDDARAALDVGCRCVLFDGGSHLRGELLSSGAPVIDSLRAVVPLVKGFG